MPTSWFTYDFGYSWPFTSGHLIVALLAAAAAVVCWWTGRRSGAVGAAVIALWAAAGAAVMHAAVQINTPQRLPTEAFLPGGAGHVIDLGAGSGRATIGVLLARSQARVTAVDLYRGYYGIDENTPERLRRNAGRAGVEGRVQVDVADMRQLPFRDASFDGAVSVAAIDHLGWDDISRALLETARVLRPRGQLLVISLNPDAWVRIAMPWSLHGGGFWGRSPNAARWRDVLAGAGFAIVEEGTRPATRFVLAEKRVE